MNKKYSHRSFQKLAIVGAVALLVLPAAHSGSSPGVTWQQTDHSLALLKSGVVVWQLNYAKAEGKPYFHPLTVPGGTVLTALRPKDHPWHRGLWWSWKFINGLNYWEEDKQTGQSQGTTELTGLHVTTESNGVAVVTMELSYHPPQQAPVLTENRTLRMSAPDAQGDYTIDWTATFTAGPAAVKLDRTPPHGSAGGYAGLSCRLAPATKGWLFTSSTGATEAKNIYGQTGKWLDFSHGAGITILDHPGNLRHPTAWYPNESMPFFEPALLFHEPYTLPAGTTLALRYRVLVHAGALDKAALETQWEKFAKGE